MRTAGLVLCGGQSSRMGQPKAWLPFHGEPLLARTLMVLAQAVPTLIAVAAPGQELPPLPEGVIVTRDPQEGHGPLQGVAAGLEALMGLADVAYISSCDVPFLEVAFIQRMFALLGDHAIAVPDVAGRRHPLAGVYRVSVLPTVRELLAADQRRVGALLERVPTRLVAEAELPGLASLSNLNTPEEYQAALRKGR